MKRIHYILAAALVFTCFFAFVLSPAWAQDAEPVIAPSSWLYEIWTIVQPVVVLLVSTVGPVLVTWIAARVISLLKVTDEKQRGAIEAQLREALHQSALNAMKYAFTKVGIPSMGGAISPILMSEAISYVTEKNPETLQKLGVDQKALKEILLSKVPEIIQSSGQ